MKIGIRANDLGKSTTLELFNECKKYQIVALQLPLSKTLEIAQDNPTDIKVANEINKYKGDIEVRVLSCYINPSVYDEKLRQQELDKFKSFIRFAPLVNAYMVGTETGSYNYDTSYHEWNNSEEAYEVFKSSLLELLVEAKKYNVNIGIEPVRSHVINSPERVKRIIDDINDDHLKIIFDPVNILNLNNHTNQIEVFNKCNELFGNKIRALHITDYNIVNDKFKKLPIGKGMLNLEYVLKTFSCDYYLMESVGIDDISRSISEIKNKLK